MEAEVIPYIISILLEILELEGTQLIIFFDIHLLFFIILLLNNIGVPNSFTKVSYFANILLGYLFIAYIAYSVNIVKREKEKVTTLNTKLRQYALEVEELTISKERTLLAQELHDSLGHSLTALYMHLEFAKNICDRNPDEVKDLIIKSEELTKSSIDSLRESVYLLKHSNKIESFEKSIQSLINNFNNINNLKFNLNTSGNLDSLNSVIKNSMYQTIKESITNSIKHGKATKINIDILLDNNKLSINLNDNGIGCTNIIKSNGLLGIEDRVHSLNGSVNYLHGTTVPGFFIEICIPNIMEEIINDKCNSS